MIRRRLAAIAAGIIFAVTGTATAHATPAQPVQVKIYLENNNHNPGTVTADCGPDGGRLHTALFNDAIGANTIETAKIYREDGGPANAANWPVIFGPVDVPIGGHVNVNLPYVTGTSYNAVAIPKGDPWPATLADILARLSAKPPTADNSQLFPSGYPTAPADCPTPTPTPTTTKPCAGELDQAAAKCPCPTVPPVNNDALLAVPKCPPTSTPSTSATSSATPTSSVSSSASATPTPLPSGTSTATSATVSAATPTSPTGPALAHTGASVLPYAAVAAGLLAAGGATMLHVRRKRHAHQ